MTDGFRRKEIGSDCGVEADFGLNSLIRYTFLFRVRILKHGELENCFCITSLQKINR